MPIEKIDQSEIFRIIDEISRKFDCNFDLNEFRDKIFLKSSNFIMVFSGNGEILEKYIKKDIVYSAGLIFGIITKKFGVLPFITISNILVENCRKKLVLPQKLTEKLTYGKKIILKERIPNGFYIVLSKENEFIGIVRIRKGREIIPILDIGWYLRKGG